MNVLVSVIVPIYNVEQYLDRCLSSILEQTHQNYELILVDDGSSDNCGFICDQYKNRDNRVHVIHKENGGLSDARNAGIEWVLKNSDSQYFSFIDSDDFVHRRFLEWMVKAITQTDSDIVICERTRDMDYDKFFAQSKYSVTIYDKHDFLLSTYTGSWSRNIATWTKIYKRDIFADLRFPFGKKYEDGITIHKALMKADKICGVNVPLYYWYQNSSSISSQRQSASGLLDREEALRGHMSFYPYKDVNDAACVFYLNQMHYMMWDIDHYYINSPENVSVKKALMKQAKKYYRKHKMLLSDKDKSKLSEYLFPWENVILSKIRRK